MSIQDHFDQFYENIKPTNNQLGDAQTKYTEVCETLYKHYYPNSHISYLGRVNFPIGSYGKGTHIRPVRDVDVLFIMPFPVFEKYWKKPNGQSRLLQEVRGVLTKKYPKTPIKVDRKVVVLEFSTPKHNVELLPACDSQDKRFYTPDTTGNGTWFPPYDPYTEMQEIKNSDNRTGKTIMLIRMIKKWPENCNVDLSSYDIEQEVLEFLKGKTKAQCNSHSILVRDFLKDLLLYAPFRYHDRKNLLKPIETACKRAINACEFEEQGNVDLAVQEWQKIFGDNDFPSKV